MASNKERFISKLKQAIKMQMEKYPERFSKIVLDNKNYPTEFANHMISKLGSGSVIAINDTVAIAMELLGREASFIEVYKYLKLTPPSPLKNTDEEEVKPKVEVTRQPPIHVFRGC